LKPADAELDGLLATLGCRVVATVVQRRPRPDPRTYVGSGKLAEVALALRSFALGEEADAPAPASANPGRESGRKRSRSASAARRRRDHPPKDAVIPRVVVDGALSPGQHHFIEHELASRHRLKVDVRDRFLIVLEIFERRALTKEAKLQVELARLGYMTPFVKEWFHAGVAGEHPGFMAGGEYGVEEFLRYIRRRTVSIRRELEASEARGAAERRIIKERGWAIAGLAGYTNAGKSTLFSALSGVRAEADDRMFTTLSPKSAGVTRGTDGRLQARGRVKLLVEDTIGFIEGMPHLMIEGFRATLRRLRAADLTILLIDASDSPREMERKLRTSLSVLGGEGVQELVPVLSKSDAAGAGRLEEAASLAKEATGRAPFAVSSLTGEGLDHLVSHLLSSTPAMERVELSLGAGARDPATVSRMAGLMVDYRFLEDGSAPRLAGWCRREIAPRLMAMARGDEREAA
jgi:GTP-binding protein HflX